MKWYHFEVPIPKATARGSWRTAIAVAEAAAGNGFSSTYRQKVADDLNYTQKLTRHRNYY